jgi:hypothetical protein
LDLTLDFRELLAGSGGARRNGIVDSGGLQRKWYRYGSRTCEGTKI